MPAQFLGRGGLNMGLGSGGAAAVDWWLAGGTLTLGNIVEHPENIAPRTAYTGGALGLAWTIAMQCTLSSLPASTAFALDTSIGRIIIGVNVPENGIYDGTAWRDITLFATGKHTYMLCSDGTNIQAYRDNVAIGTAYASDKNISAGATTRWGSRYDVSGGNWYDWPVSHRAGLIADIGLSATQRAALHTSMMALA